MDFTDYASRHKTKIGDEATRSASRVIRDARFEPQALASRDHRICQGNRNAASANTLKSLLPFLPKETKADERKSYCYFVKFHLVFIEAIDQLAGNL
jgi:hypothetical protein